MAALPLASALGQPPRPPQWQAWETVPLSFPRGAITELTGPRSSGRTSLLHACLAEATRRLECCAVVDTGDVFDPASAARSGVDLRRLLWVRCGGNAETAFKAADLLLHGGGFGLVCLDLSELAPRVLNRVPLSCWFRFRRAIQDTPTIFLLLAERPQAKSCAACWVEFGEPEVLWSGQYPARLLRGLRPRLVLRKPGPPSRHSFESLAS